MQILLTTDNGQRILPNNIKSVKICKIRVICVLLTCFIFLQAENAAGDDFKLIPSVALKQNYNDNIFFDRTRIYDFITTVSPKLEVVEKTERIDAGISGRMDWVRYADNSAINSNDEFYTGHLEYRATPRINLSASAGYTRDFQTDRDIEETGLLLGTSLRRKYNFTLSGDYVLTETTSSGLSYFFNQDKYDNPEDYDSKSQRINLGFAHNLGDWIPLTTGRLNMGYTRNTYTNATTSVRPIFIGNEQVDYDNTVLLDYYSWTLGASRPFSEVLTALVDLGAGYTRQEQTRAGRVSYDLLPFLNSSLPATTETSESWSGVGQMELSYQGEYNTAKVTLSYDVQPGSGQTGTTQRTSLLVAIGRKFTDKLRASLSAGYHLNKANKGELATQDVDKQSLNISPSVRYDYTRDIALEASYTYSTATDKVADTEFRRNLMFLRLAVQYPLFE